jgi:hypothetical protein
MRDNFGMHPENLTQWVYESAEPFSLTVAQGVMAHRIESLHKQGHIGVFSVCGFDGEQQRLFWASNRRLTDRLDLRTIPHNGVGSEEGFRPGDHDVFRNHALKGIYRLVINVILE